MIVAFIPVRCGSKSIPLKNIKLFCGKPLVYWTLESLQNTLQVERIVLATDCNEIMEVVKGFNFSKVEIFERSTENANDTASTESVVLEFIAQGDIADSDLFLLVQATSPFTKNKDFELAINKLKIEKSDSLLTCVKTKRFFWGTNGLPINYDYKNRPRRQDFKGIYMENGAFYLNYVKNIKKYSNRLSGKISIFEMPEYTSMEIDEPDDWDLAEAIFKKQVQTIDKRIQKIKLFFSDVDGTLTDAGMYYDQSGNELKKFNTHDGKGFELLRSIGVKTGLVTSENTKIVSNRAKKLKIDYLIQGVSHLEKLNSIREICIIEGIGLDEVAYIGDDLNCKELLQNVGIAACPENALPQIKSIPNILKLNKAGGNGAVREFVDYLLQII